jgi:hypothetical protein
VRLTSEFPKMRCAHGIFPQPVSLTESQNTKSGI